MTLERRPIYRDAALRFVAAHHRHAPHTPGWLFGTSLWEADELRAVGMAGRPIAPALDDGLTLEVTRVCTLGDPNACSMLYGALCRAAKALGFRRAITYTLACEPGTSPTAAGFTYAADVKAEGSWARRARHRYDADLFGNPRRDPGPKIRWQRDL